MNGTICLEFLRNQVECASPVGFIQDREEKMLSLLLYSGIWPDFESD